jgi:hypothetical protein
MTGLAAKDFLYFAVASPWAFMTWLRSARVQHAFPKCPGLLEGSAGVHPVNCFLAVVVGVPVRLSFVEAGRVMRFVGSMVLPR